MSSDNNDKDGVVSDYIDIGKEAAGNAIADSFLMDTKIGDTIENNIDFVNQSQLQEDREFITRPSSDNIVKSAYEEYLSENNLSHEESSIDNPKQVIVESEVRFAQVRDDIVKEIERIESKAGEKTGEDIETMIYIIEKNAGRSGMFTILGGAESLMWNTGSRYSWSDEQTELILKANNLAAEENDYERHLLLDSVAILPNNVGVTDPTVEL
jgi:hypothetical protein